MSDTPVKIVHGTALTDEQKKDLLHRLARVEGQIRGVQKLIANAAVPADCEASPSNWRQLARRSTELLSPC